jgi:osmotically inducible protein OsmC
MKKLYTAVVAAHGGRDGHVRSSDGVLDMDVKVPKEMGGPGGPGTNPEQLFAAGYAACFESAMRTVARLDKKPLIDASVTAHVAFNMTEDHKYILSVALHAQLEGSSHDDTLALMRRAHEVCPYSNATRGNIEVELVAD